MRLLAVLFSVLATSAQAHQANQAVPTCYGRLIEQGTWALLEEVMADPGKLDIADGHSLLNAAIALPPLEAHTLPIAQGLLDRSTAQSEFGAAVRVSGGGGSGAERMLVAVQKGIPPRVQLLSDLEQILFFHKMAQEPLSGGHFPSLTCFPSFSLRIAANKLFPLRNGLKAKLVSYGMQHVLTAEEWDVLNDFNHSSNPPFPKVWELYANSDKRGLWTTSDVFVPAYWEAIANWASEDGPNRDKALEFILVFSRKSREFIRRPWSEKAVQLYLPNAFKDALKANQDRGDLKQDRRVEISTTLIYWSSPDAIRLPAKPARKTWNDGPDSFGPHGIM
ncbi:hypothetical protein K2X33_11355 [bacterium]|nr:hypothetical protein [bacterium]